MKEIIEKHKHGIRAFLLQNQKDLIQYWENKFDPESRYHYGFSTHERAEIEREKLKSMMLESILIPTRHELANYLRLEAIKEREQARSFPDNVWIKWRSLRRSIGFINDLLVICPELNQYSFHWIASRNPIHL